MKRKMQIRGGAAALLGASTVSAAADLPPALADAIRRELPPALAAVVPAGSLSWDGPEGVFRAEVGEMDGAEPPETIVLVDASGRPPTFLAHAGTKVFRKAVKLPVRSEPFAVAFHTFAPGKSLAQISAGAGSVLVGWDGKKLEVVWESGKPRPGESRWFELDDLDDDGVREIVMFQRTELDAALDDEMGETSTGSSAESLGPTSVMRWTDGKWREDRAALDTLR